MSLWVPQHRLSVCAVSAPGTALAAEKGTDKPQRPLRLALASYTLRNFNLDQTLTMTQRVGLDAICLKSFHLPLESTPEQIQAAAAKVKEAGIQLYGGGVISMGNEAEVNQAFDYAKAAGMSKIIGVPAPKMLPLVNDKVQQYDIQVCIHNHGPGDDVYTTPDLAYERIKTLDKRIGLCHDVGHTVAHGQRSGRAVGTVCRSALGCPHQGCDRHDGQGRLHGVRARCHRLAQTAADLHQDRLLGIPGV